VATEAGIMERLRLEASEKTCYQAPPGSVCAQMKENTLRLVLETLEREQNKVVIRKETRIKAKEALDGMLNVA
jgi:quinolinate synthase